jgi:hypothetical protein
VRPSQAESPPPALLAFPDLAEEDLGSLIPDWKKLKISNPLQQEQGE